MFYNIAASRISVQSRNKIDLQDICNNLENGQLGEADDDFMKFCKGMYSWLQPNLAIDERKSPFMSLFFRQAINLFFKQDQHDQVIYVFNNIDKIECKDEKFKKVKEILSLLRLDYSKEDTELLQFVDIKKIDDENEKSFALRKKISEESKKTDHMTNPYTAPAIIGILIPIVPSIVFVINVAYNDKYKFNLTVYF